METGTCTDASSGFRFVAVITASRWRRNPAGVQPWSHVRSALFRIQSTSGGGPSAGVRVHEDVPVDEAPPVRRQGTQEHRHRFRAGRRNLWARRRACDQRERRDPIRGAHGDELGDTAALRKPDDVGPLDPEPIEKADDVVGVSSRRKLG